MSIVLMRNHWEYRYKIVASTGVSGYNIDTAVECERTTMSKEEISWRLSNLPTVEELRDLVKDKIITQDEAREILFRTETIEDKDIKSLESEVKFLKELVERLSMGYTSPVTIGYPRWYQSKPWITCYASSGALGNVQLSATTGNSWIN